MQNFKQIIQQVSELADKMEGVNKHRGFLFAYDTAILGDSPSEAGLHVMACTSPPLLLELCMRIKDNIPPNAWKLCVLKHAVEEGFVNLDDAINYLGSLLEEVPCNTLEDVQHLERCFNQSLS